LRKTHTKPAGGIALEDLRLVLAIAEAGSLAGAVRSLGIDHSSGFRRLGALETRLGARLFDRSRAGYAPTPAGEIAIAAAARVGEEIDALERRLLGQDLRLSGTVRVTTTDTLLHVVAPLFADFRRAEPGIVIEVAAANTLFDLSRRDADLAIRPIATVPDHLVARQVATIACAVYAAPSYLATHDPHALAENDWIAPDASLSHAAAARWLTAHVAAERVVHRADSLLALLQAAKAGIGMTVLPCYLGDAEPALQRVGAPLPEAAVPLWLITHPDLRQVRRVRILSEFLWQQLRALEAVFLGDKR
jgi:DNA-binding transcriptional LysR family regulator